MDFSGVIKLKVLIWDYSGAFNVITSFLQVREEVGESEEERKCEGEAKVGVM